MKTIEYHYRGNVERGTGNGYRWHSGFSENTEKGEPLYPWMTMKECGQDARNRGAQAKFVYPKLSPAFVNYVKTTIQ